MISKQKRAVSITDRGSRIYDRFAKYDIIYNLKIITRLSAKCVYKDEYYKFSVRHIVNFCLLCCYWIGTLMTFSHERMSELLCNFTLAR